MQRGAPQIRAGEVGPIQLGAAEIGADQLRAPQARRAQIGAAQVGPDQPGTGEVGRIGAHSRPDRQAGLAQERIHPLA